MTQYQLNVLMCDPKVLCKKFKGDGGEVRSFIDRLNRQNEQIADWLAASIKRELGVDQ